MTRVATMVPAETDLLCEGCGYTLNGLPQSGNCPECGKPIAQSIGTQRIVPPWEHALWPRRGGLFLDTTWQIIFHPARFYQTLATRRQTRPAFRFAQRHWIIASVFLGLAAGVHVTWYSNLYGTGLLRAFPAPLLWITFIIAAYPMLWGTTEIAAKLTHWEATYRGLRLPLPVVQRGLYYHAAHYLPVGFLALVTVVGYMELVKADFLGVNSAVYYLYTLCAEVILAAGYLFKTYWIGMKNMMYANR
jgi:hypothetical protein